MSELIFKTLSAIDVNKYVKTKQNQRFLPWTHALAELTKVYPDSSYDVLENDNGLPYFESNLGFMVKTTVTIEEKTIKMMLPVLDGVNRALKSEPYSYMTKNGEKHVNAATMFDINTSIMRCLTKNIAAHGLGLYIYTDDLMPEIPTIDSKQISEITKLAGELKVDLIGFNNYFGVNRVSELYESNFDVAIEWIKGQM